MTKGLQGWKLSKAHTSLSVKSFSGAIVEDMESYAVPTMRADPDIVFVHIGTSDLQRLKQPREIAEGIVNLADNISLNCTKCCIAISSIIKHFDKPQLNPKLSEVNEILKKKSK